MTKSLKQISLFSTIESLSLKEGFYILVAIKIYETPFQKSENRTYDSFRVSAFFTALGAGSVDSENDPWKNPKTAKGFI